MTLFRELISMVWVKGPDGQLTFVPRMDGKCRDKDGNVWFICNGRPIVDRGPGAHEHIYICAKNKSDACRLMDEWWRKIRGGRHTILLPNPSKFVNEINEYYSKGAWGNMLNNTAVERGLWVQWKQSDQVVEKVV